jgi:hypothetical protein
MNRLGWSLRQRGGKPLAAAAAALLVALALGLGFTPRWADEARSLQEQALALQREARDAELRTLQSATNAGPAAEPQLPAADTTSSRMADLLALAVRNGVTVQRLQRVGSDNADANAGRSTLVMPVRAAYADLRRLVAQALLDDPALALERISLRRNRTDAVELEGELQWALLHRAGLRPQAPQPSTTDVSMGRQDARVVQ